MGQLFLKCRQLKPREMKLLYQRGKILQIRKVLPKLLWLGLVDGLSRLS